MVAMCLQSQTLREGEKDPEFRASLGKGNKNLSQKKIQIIGLGT
jgi:hypothetical protein